MMAGHLWEDVIVAPLLLWDLHHCLWVLVTPALCHNQDGQNEDDEDGHEEDDEDGADGEGKDGEDDGDGEEEEADKRTTHGATVTLTPPETDECVRKKKDQISSRFLSKEELEDPEYWAWHVAESEVSLFELPAQEHVRDQRALPVTRSILVNLKVGVLGIDLDNDLIYESLWILILIWIYIDIRNTFGYWFFTSFTT